MQPTIDVLEKKIYLIRNKKVMIDRDLAELYEVKTKRLNEQVKRNIDRFPKDFMFQLSTKEFSEITNYCPSYGGQRRCPYAFTEQGIAMLSSVLNSQKAIQINIQIMRIFVQLREITTNYKKLADKITIVERKYDKQFKIIFDTIRDCLIPSSQKKRRAIGLIKE